jgi:serpin B
VLFRSGQLKQAFDSNLTQQPFYLSPNQTIPVNMMSGRGMQYGYYSDNEVKIADLPYGNGIFSLSVIMSNGNNTLDNLVNSLSNARWDMWMNSLTYGPSPTLFLPRFYVAHNTSCKAMLTSFGMGVAFEDNANFSNLSDAPISIANVTQKTIFEVNGKGILPPAEPSTSATTTFTVNKPFLIALRDRDSGRIIMIGKVMNPNI